MKKGFLLNKYTVSLFIVLALLLTDILLHKGMSRSILPESFTNKIKPQTGIENCNRNLLSGGKQWIKAVNTPETMLIIDSSANGFEMDIYFDTLFNNFFVYHDTDKISNVKAEDIFEIMLNRRLNTSVWLDFKNLDNANAQQSLTLLLQLKNKFSLEDKIIVESTNARALKIFCDSGFFTSYYVPLFNPYQEEEHLLVNRIDSIAATIKQYPVSALSGYYFQTPFLKKFFPAFPILTWTDDSKISLVNSIFNKKLEADDNIKIVLHPIDN